TGAILPCCSSLSAGGSSDLRMPRKRRLSMVVAFSGLGRSARTIDEARALVPTLSILPVRSLRIGHVAVMAQPPRIMPSRRVSQPVDDSPPDIDSDCLNA